MLVLIYATRWESRGGGKATELLKKEVNVHEKPVCHPTKHEPR